MVLLVAVALSSCATPVEHKPAQLGSGNVSSEMLLEASPLVTTAPSMALPEVDILDVSPEMQVFLDDHVRGRRNDDEKLRLLVFAVMGEGTFDLIYDESTRTAHETFDDRRGNCLSFTNMFIAMARYLQLDAEYQEVRVPPDWSLSGQTLLLSRHVNVMVRIGDARTVIDFNMPGLDIDYARRTISDQRARAHYFNNLGVEHMLEDRSGLALAHYRQALKEDGGFAPAWVNLGILHRREGYPAHAEAAYLLALQSEPDNRVAMSNLANLYDEQGLVALAARYRQEVESHRMRNPYYRYMLANEAFANGDYGAAIEHLEFALRTRTEDPRFYSLMSMSYLMIGDRRQSMKWMRKAEEAAIEDSEREQFSRKLNLLMQEYSR